MGIGKTKMQTSPTHAAGQRAQAHCPANEVEYTVRSNDHHVRHIALLAKMARTAMTKIRGDSAADNGSKANITLLEGRNERHEQLRHAATCSPEGCANNIHG